MKMPNIDGMQVRLWGWMQRIVIRIFVPIGVLLFVLLAIAADSIKVSMKPSGYRQDVTERLENKTQGTDSGSAPNGWLDKKDDKEVLTLLVLLSLPGAFLFAYFGKLTLDQSLSEFVEWEKKLRRAEKQWRKKNNVGRLGKAVAGLEYYKDRYEEEVASGKSVKKWFYNVLGSTFHAGLACLAQVNIGAVFLVENQIISGDYLHHNYINDMGLALVCLIVGGLVAGLAAWLMPGPFYLPRAVVRSLYARTDKILAEWEEYHHNGQAWKEQKHSKWREGKNKVKLYLQARKRQLFIMYHDGLRLIDSVVCKLKTIPKALVNAFISRLPSGLQNRFTPKYKLWAAALNRLALEKPDFNEVADEVSALFYRMLEENPESSPYEIALKSYGLVSRQRQEEEERRREAEKRQQQQRAERERKRRERERKERERKERERKEREQQEKAKRRQQGKAKRRRRQKQQQTEGGQANTLTQLPEEKMLKVRAGASMEEIKVAYRKLVRRHHPDQFATASYQKRSANERRLKEINAAYEVLKKLRG